VVAKKYNDWHTDLSRSVKSFKVIAREILPNMLKSKSCKVINLESLDGCVVAKMLDINSGIDWMVKDEDGCFGIASRCQYGHNFDTFTIRERRKSGVETELEKRKAAIKSGRFYPMLTMQAYFSADEREILSCAVMLTKDLYELHDKRPNLFSRNRSDNDFIFIHWQSIVNQGVPIKIYREGQFVKHNKRAA